MRIWTDMYKITDHDRRLSGLYLTSATYRSTWFSTLRLHVWDKIVFKSRWKILSLKCRYCRESKSGVTNPSNKSNTLRSIILTCENHKLIITLCNLFFTCFTRISRYLPRRSRLRLAIARTTNHHPGEGTRHHRNYYNFRCYVKRIYREHCRGSCNSFSLLRHRAAVHMHLSKDKMFSIA